MKGYILIIFQPIYDRSHLEIVYLDEVNNRPDRIIETSDPAPENSSFILSVWKWMIILFCAFIFIG